MWSMGVEDDKEWARDDAKESAKGTAQDAADDTQDAAGDVMMRLKVFINWLEIKSRMLVMIVVCF